MIADLELDGVIAIGGDGTAAASNRLFNDGINIVGVPRPSTTTLTPPTTPSGSTRRSRSPPGHRPAAHHRKLTNAAWCWR